MKLLFLTGGMVGGVRFTSHNSYFPFKTANPPRFELTEYEDVLSVALKTGAPWHFEKTDHVGFRIEVIFFTKSSQFDKFWDLKPPAKTHDNRQQEDFSLFSVIQKCHYSKQLFFCSISGNETGI